MFQHHLLAIQNSCHWVSERVCCLTLDTCWLKKSGWNKNNIGNLNSKRSRGLEVGRATFPFESRHVRSGLVWWHQTLMVVGSPSSQGHPRPKQRSKVTVIAAIKTMEKKISEHSLDQDWNTKVATREASGVKSPRAWHSLQTSSQSFWNDMSFESAKPWKVTKLIQISFFSAHLTSSDHLTVKAPRIYVALLAPHTLMPSAQKVGFIHSRWRRTTSRSWLLFGGIQRRLLILLLIVTQRRFDMLQMTPEYCFWLPNCLKCLPPFRRCMEPVAVQACQCRLGQLQRTPWTIPLPWPWRTWQVEDLVQIWRLGRAREDCKSSS